MHKQTVSDGSQKQRQNLTFRQIFAQPCQHGASSEKKCQGKKEKKEENGRATHTQIHARV